jgi:signal recognition particle subunit SRP54
MDALEVFHPDRMAQRILGMGDVLSLIERAEQALDAQETADLEKKLRQNSFDFDDFMNAMRQMKQLGSMKQILGMLPGMSAQLKDVDIDESKLKYIEGMIQSMTKAERQNPDILNGSRRRRVAIGSGTTIQEVNSLINRFGEMRKMMSTMSKMGAAQGKGKPGFPGLGAPPPGMGMGGGNPFGGGFGGGRPMMPGMPGKHAAGSANKKKKQKNRGGYPFGR